MSRKTLIALSAAIALTAGAPYALADNTMATFDAVSPVTAMPVTADGQTQDGNCMCMCQTNSGPERLTVPFNQLQTAMYNNSDNMQAANNTEQATDMTAQAADNTSNDFVEDNSNVAGTINSTTTNFSPE